MLTQIYSLSRRDYLGEVKLPTQYKDNYMEEVAKISKTFYRKQLPIHTTA